VSYSKENIQEIATQFIDSQLIELISPLGNGHIHQTYLVSMSNKNSFVLQCMNTDIFRHPKGVVENMQLIADHLVQLPNYAMKILRPLPTREGQLLYVDDRNKYWRATPFFAHTTSYSCIETPRQAAAAARAFGQFASALQDFPTQQLNVTLPGFHDSISRYQHYETIKKAASTDRLIVANDIIRFIEQESHLFRKIANLNLPLRAVHNDTKADNVLLDATTDKGICVIDLDTVMPGTILSDFGDMVRTFTNSHAEDDDKFEEVEARYAIFEALSNAYLEETASFLTEVERKHLLEGALWIVLEQALRFLTDYLANDVYYSIQYPTHNLVRAKNQMALWQSIWRQRKQWRHCLSSPTRSTRTYL
jgi:Ser/Thr protein kinase RdoA (MazF antagonist)